jgi:threonine/homoserine/homoserine lactone efflux protein
VIAAVLAGLLAGYSVAVPVGPMTTYLIALTARTSVRIGVAAALGIASVDGAYAIAATLGGTAVVELLRPALGVLHWVSVAVLVGVAARAVRSGFSPVAADRPREAHPMPGPARAFATMAGLTAGNPTTLSYFVALVVGLRAGAAAGALEQALFVTAAFVASASWQLALACGGALLGRLVADARGHRAMALVSGVLIAVSALKLALS